MKILLVGATGTIGAAVAKALAGRHEVLPASHTRAKIKVDLEKADSIRQMYARSGRVHAVICAAGQAAFKPLRELSDEEFALSLASKLMGQVNLVRLGIQSVEDGGSFTLTSGILARHPMPGSAAVSLVNAALEGFARAAALDLPRGLRINVVSPDWLKETLAALNMDPGPGVAAAEVARVYLEAVEGTMSGQVLEAVGQGTRA
jgi:NAD(P)-dependent dehydrogenase (short-subunit alcohol dehydrogenase family)